MLYILDTANIEHIKRAFDLYPMSGVTTNPSIIAKEKGDFLAILQAIRRIIGGESMLHVQAVSTQAEGIIEEAEYLQEALGGNLYIKIPVLPEGIKAMKLLQQKKIKTTATAIFTAQQALVAAAAGAEFVAPYVNRLDNISANGVQTVAQIVQLFKAYGYPARVLAASFKNVQQVHEVALAGAQAVTIGSDIMAQLLKHPLTDWSVEQFIRDWESLYGAGKTTLPSR